MQFEAFSAYLDLSPALSGKILTIVQLDQVIMGNNKNPLTVSKTELVNGPVILERIFPDKRCRPSIRWLRSAQKAKMIPFKRVGGFVMFDPGEVRAALDKRTVRCK